MSEETVDSVQRKVKKGDYFITDKSGLKLSKVWNNFGVIARPASVRDDSEGSNSSNSEIIEGFVGCKGCKQVYTFSKLTGTSTLAKHTVETRKY
jgi:hypothetical protein